MKIKNEYALKRREELRNKLINMEISFIDFRDKTLELGFSIEDVLADVNIVNLLYSQSPSNYIH